MQEKLVLKTSELSKTKKFKDIQKNIEEREKLQKKLNSLEFDVREQIAKYNVFRRLSLLTRRVRRRGRGVLDA